MSTKTTKNKEEPTVWWGDLKIYTVETPSDHPNYFLDPNYGFKDFLEEYWEHFYCRECFPNASIGEEVWTDDTLVIKSLEYDEFDDGETIVVKAANGAYMNKYGKIASEDCDHKE